MLCRMLSLLVALCVAVAGSSAVANQKKKAAKQGPPKVGAKAHDFTLKTPRGREVQLSKLLKKGPVVLLVLRGYPGYQCPVCSKQVGDYIAHAKDFDKAHANVVMVYPGSIKGLDKRALEFLKGKSLPKNFHLVIDPSFRFTNAWHLRWAAPRETAYPSTFVINRAGKITFAQVSKTHLGRTRATTALKALGVKVK